MEAPRDNNHIPTLLGTSNADGSTPVVIKANPTTHILDVDCGVAGSDLSDDIASRDGNRVPVAMAVSSVDGETPVAIYADPANGKLLTKST